jgi:hypothetical protein
MRKEKTPSNAFSHVPRTARGDFRIHFYAAVYQLIRYLRRLSQAGGEDLEQTFEKYPFLSAHFEEITRCLPGEVTWQTAMAWWRSETADWRRENTEHLPLEALSQEGTFDYPDIIALMVVGLVEEDSRFGTLFSDMQGPLAFRRPCLELLERIMADPAGGDPWNICRSLLDAGLLEVLNQDAPRSEWVLRVPPVLWHVIRGETGPQPAPWCEYLDARQFPSLEKLVFPGPFLARLKQVPVLLKSGKAEALVLRGTPGSERLAAAGALARAMDGNIIKVDPKYTCQDKNQKLEPLGLLCSMTRSIPLAIHDLNPGETVEIDLLKGYNGPFFILTGFEGGLEGKAVEKAAALTLPRLHASHRKRCWQEALAGRPVENLDKISERFFIPGGYIRQAASMAAAHAALESRRSIGIPDVRHACRRLNRQLLDTLAAYLDTEGSWDCLVVNRETGEKLAEIEQRCRYREKLSGNLGPAFGSGGNTGVRVLFSGASGTGKTLAAKTLAAELEMDLYRVDLAAVVNKYIGETEKNLHRVLTRAEELDVILLLDEGDALLGARTEVKTANDRYANLETDYLLQKLENYQGIVLITTNAVENIDSAFQRRMDVVVNFIPPREQERLQIWQLHLPETHAVDGAFLEEVSIRCTMTGGQIRNAALHAVLLALEEPGQTVAPGHLRQAIKSEYRKAGAIYPLRDEQKIQDNKSGMDAFFKGRVS